MSRSAGPRSIDLGVGSRAWRLVASIGSVVTAIALGGCHDGTDRTERPPPCEPMAFATGEHAPDRYDLFRLDEDGNLTRVTSDLATFDPAVAPDGSWLAAVRADTSGWSDLASDMNNWIVVMRPDGSVAARVPSRSGWWDHSPSVAPSGDRLAFLRREKQRGLRSQVVLADRDGTILRELPRGAYVGRPAWKPDGSAIAVIEEDLATDRHHLVVIDVESGTTQSWPVEVDGDPVFAADGTRILVSGRGYETGGPIVEVDLASGHQTTIDQPGGSNWTNATYADRAGATLRVLRFEQTVELRPQRLEVVDRDSKLQSSTVLEVVPLVDGEPGTQTLLSGLSSSACFTTG